MGHVNLIGKTSVYFILNFHVSLEIYQDFICALLKILYMTLCWSTNGILEQCTVIDLVSRFYVWVHAYFVTCVYLPCVYFHACASTRRVPTCVYFHEMCTLHDTSKRGPRKRITGMHCSIVMVPCKITHGKMKLQLSGTVAMYM